MQAAFQYAKDISAVSVELNVLGFNEEAIQFYKTLGFQTKSRQLEYIINE
jgi:ribosomal protein S18 acetylase RimI-like enzyme